MPEQSSSSQRVLQGVVCTRIPPPGSLKCSLTSVLWVWAEKGRKRECSCSQAGLCCAEMSVQQNKKGMNDGH